MSLYIAVLLVIAACVVRTHQSEAEEVKLQNEVQDNLRRFSTNVVHQDPKHPDKFAKSEIKVDFGFTPIESNQQNEENVRHKPKPFQNTQNTQTESVAFENDQQSQVPVAQASASPISNNQQQNYPQQFPIQNHYHSQENPTLPSYPTQQSEQRKYQDHFPNSQIRIVQPPIIHPTPSAFQNPVANTPNPYTNPQPQLFNVGYSVSFAKGSHFPKPYPNIPEGEGEIITGTRSREVEKPHILKGYSNAPVQEEKVHKSNKHHKSRRPSNLNINSNSNVYVKSLTPKTVKELENLEKGSTRQHENIQNAPSAKFNAWQSLGPNVEIYHSPPASYNYHIQEPDNFRNTKNFDHVGALGNSQGFDYNNAVDGPKGTTNNPQANAQPPNGQFGKKPLDNFYQGHFSEQPIIVFDQFSTENPTAVQNNIQFFPQVFPDFPQKVQQVPFVPGTIPSIFPDQSINQFYQQLQQGNQLLKGIVPNYNSSPPPVLHNVQQNELQEQPSISLAQAVEQDKLIQNNKDIHHSQHVVESTASSIKPEREGAKPKPQQGIRHLPSLPSRKLKERFNYRGDSKYRAKPTKPHQNPVVHQKEREENFENLNTNYNTFGQKLPKYQKVRQPPVDAQGEHSFINSNVHLQPPQPQMFDQYLQREQDYYEAQQTRPYQHVQLAPKVNKHIMGVDMYFDHNFDQIFQQETNNMPVLVRQPKIHPKIRPNRDYFLQTSLKPPPLSVIRQRRFL